jgi:DNA-binding IscR family transcriptional regulator
VTGVQTCALPIYEVLELLVKNGLMAEVADRPGHFVLCKTPDSIPIKDVLEIIIQAGFSPKSLGLDALNPAIRHILGRVDAGTGEALKNFSLTNLLHLHSRLAGENNSPEAPAK